MATKATQEQLVSLGFAFHGRPSAQPADPEKIILELLSAFYEDRKTFRIMLRWLLTTSELIHVERLAALAKYIASEDKAVLGALALKLVRAGDRRWAMIVERAKVDLEKHPSSSSAPEEYADPYLVEKYGTDAEFLAFGLKTATVSPEDEKKVLTLAGILKGHGWLRLRALMGPCFRADLAYLRITAEVSNPNQAIKILGCSRETAYRLWRALSLYDGLHRLVAAA